MSASTPPTLRALRAYLATLLDVSIDAVDVDATLFELGANSMTLLEILSELEQRYDRRIPPRDVFEQHNTLRKLAAMLDQPGIAPLAEATTHSELPNQSQIAFLRSFSPGALGAYSEACCIFLPQPPAHSQLARAARTVLQAQPTLAQVSARVHEHDPVAATGAHAEVMRALEANTEPFMLHWVPVQDGSAYLLGLASAELLDAPALRNLLAAVLANVHGENPPAALQHPGAAFAAYRDSVDYAAQRGRALKQAACSTTLTLPHDKRRPAVKSYAGKRVLLTLPKGLQQRLVRHAQAHKATPSALVLSAWSAFLARLCRQAQVTLGLLSPSNVWEPSQASAYARSNPVLLALDVDLDQSFEAHCQRTQAAALHSLQACCLPFSDLVAAANPPRDPSRSPLFTVAFASASAGAMLPLGGQEVLLPTPFARYDLQTTLLTGDESMRLSCVFASDLLTESTVIAWLRGMIALVEAGLDSPERALNALPMGPVGLPESIARGPHVAWGPTQSIAHSLQATAAERPEAIAVQDAQGTWSYRALASRVRCIAGALQAQGVRPGEHVAICMHRTRELLAALLGIIHAGGTYVPLDPQDPEGRRGFILSDSGARFVIHDDAWEPQGDVQGLAIEGLQGPEVEAAKREANAAAYIIYTSGSTGQPKGVVIGDDNLHNLVAWSAQFFPRAAYARVLASTSICFDLSAFELYSPLLAGTTVVLVDNLFALTEAHEVTLINTVGSLLKRHLETHRLPETVQVICTSGEGLPPALAQQLYGLPHVQQVYNLYAPAETTTYSTWALAPRNSDAPIPLGIPLANTQVHLLDEARQPVLPGVVGEVYLGGAGVARGYHQREALTAERFVAHEDGTRLYRTGDQARLSGGQLYYLGRADHQIKLRGVRIEPKEVEMVLRQHPAVSDVFVRVEDQALVAYVQAKAAADNLRAELLTLAAHHLTRGALPTRWVPMKAFPRLPNGKLDPSRLTSSAPTTAETRRAPSTELERRLHAAWREVLQQTDIAMDDDFFALGGDSMHLTQLLIDLRRSMNFRLQTAAFLQNPTLAALTAQVQDSAAQEHAAESRAAQAPDRFIALEREAQDLTASTASLPAGGGGGPVLLTGATGFLGMRLLVHLLESCDRPIWTLVRAAAPEQARERLVRGMRQAGLWRPAWRDRITCVCGDLAQPEVGLDATSAARIATEVTDILHCGALVNFVYPYSALRATNVLATRAMVDLAARGRPKALHHISTIGVWPMGGHRTFKETDPLCTDTPLNLGYDESKWVAERIVQDAAKRGLRTVIYRPGEVAGDSTTGVYATGHYAWAMVRGSLQLGAFPHLECPIDLTPVDYAASAIVWLFLNRRPTNGTFHITNPGPIHSSDAYAWLRQRGYRFDVLPAQVWVKKLLGHPDFRHNALFPFAGMIDGMQRENLELPGFDSTGAQRALQGSGVGCPPVAGKLLDTYLDYFIRTGYLPTPQQEKMLGDVA